MPIGSTADQVAQLQHQLLAALIVEQQLSDSIAWYYTPMAKEFASDLGASVTVYDCMDELSAFAGAPPAMRSNEQILFADADLVFTGGATLFESKRKQHQSVHLFAS
ncbi:MAG: glycosyltransferase family 1 protein, partial [Acidobacteriaceae bacterium]|nr:glycosyltransferase family 1 protein [Acidobacteriaceae bacterium]